jgi:hypothetical protein
MPMEGDERNCEERVRGKKRRREEEESQWGDGNTLSFLSFSAVAGAMSSSSNRVDHLCGPLGLVAPRAENPFGARTGS